MEATTVLAADIGVKPACEALNIPPSSFYRVRNQKGLQRGKEKVYSSPPRTLTSEERQEVLSILHSERFIDKAPHEVYATLLDEEHYHCSISTMYRILRENKEVKERRNQRQHPQYQKPQLLASAPNEVWSWDITKLLGPEKWSYYYLYVIMDLFSRYVVGWMVADRESSELAKKLIGETYGKQDIEKDQLTIHADRGSSMKSKPVALLMSDLGVTKTHSRPYVSNDNPYSEAQFKTLKYRPEFPKRFGSIEDARSFCQGFFRWYNKEHRHSGIALLTPEVVHYGRAEKALRERQDVLSTAFEAHPERFANKFPEPQKLPKAVWINKPIPEEQMSDE
jgi:putative transposase